MRRHFFSFLFSAFGAGSVQLSMAVFGGEQKYKINAHYFDKYALVVNIGSAIAISILPYVQSTLDEQYLYVPYLGANVMLLISAILFIVGYRCRYYYIHKTSNTVLMLKWIPITIGALQSWYRSKQKPIAIAEIRVSSQGSNQNDLDDFTVTASYSRKKHQSQSSFLNFAMNSNDGRYDDDSVMDVKALGKAMLVFGLLVPYWLIYNQVKEI